MPISTLTGGMDRNGLIVFEPQDTLLCKLREAGLAKAVLYEHGWILKIEKEIKH